MRLLSPCMISGLRRTSGSSASSAPVVAKIRRTRAVVVGLAGGLDQRRDRQAGIGRAAVLLGLMRQLGEDVPAALATGSAAARRPRHAASPAGRSRTSSLATTAIVASGLPSSCAAAAASAPTAETRCSRASASWVAANASRSRRASCGDAPGIAADEHRRDHQRRPDAEDQSRAGTASGVVAPRQRQVPQRRAR